MKQRKRRKKTLKQWAAFARKGLRKRTYKYNAALHDYEHRIILRDVLALEGTTSFTAATLVNAYPGRYHITTLKVAMKRMSQIGLLEHTGHKWDTWRRGTLIVYKVNSGNARAVA
jgi:hypothetical protein